LSVDEILIFVPFSDGIYCCQVFKSSIRLAKWKISIWLGRLLLRNSCLMYKIGRSTHYSSCNLRVNGMEIVDAMDTMDSFMTELWIRWTLWTL
jgi:hypothetical protein